MTKSSARQGERDLPLRSSKRGGTNLPQVRDYNQSVVLEAIRVASGISRIELAQSTGLTAQTVSNIVKRLINQQLVIEVGRGTSGGGKPRTRLRVNAAAGYSIGMQLDRDETSLVLVDLNGAVVCHLRTPTEQEHGPLRIIEQLADGVDSLVRESHIAPELLLGIGIAVPGPLDHVQGIIYEPPNLTGWNEVPLKALVEARVGYPVVVDNDATAAAIGERWTGGARTARNFAFVYIGLGIGIGAGLFIENRVYRGSTTNAGEFGHINVDPVGPPCSCGSNGCLEIVCNTQTLVAAVQQQLANNQPSSLQAHEHPEQLSYKDICRAVLSGDDLAVRSTRQMAQIVGRAVVGMVNLLDIELVVLGGKALRDIGSIYQQEIQQVLNDTMVARKRRKVQVELSRVGEDAAAVGAAALVLYECYTPQLLGL